MAGAFSNSQSPHWLQPGGPRLYSPRRKNVLQRSAYKGRKTAGERCFQELVVSWNSDKKQAVFEFDVQYSNWALCRSDFFIVHVVHDLVIAISESSEFYFPL